ncbi:MAG: ABC transporter substrate-binding protein [Candidatus Sericytochromatia bacterium]
MLKKAVILSLLSLLTITTATTAFANKGGIINIYSQEEPENLNPIFQNSNSAKSIYNLVYSGLIKVDENYDYYPDLAVSIPTPENKGVVFNDEGMIVTYKIKELAFWHDGLPVTAEDIKFTWKCFTNPEIQQLKDAEPYKNIYKIEATDEKTVKIYFKENYPRYKDLFKYILPKHGFTPATILKIDKNHPFNLSPIGSGPFKIVDWKKGKNLVLDSYDKYYNSKPTADQVNYTFGQLNKNISKDIQNDKIHIIETKDDEYFNAKIKPLLVSTQKYTLPMAMMEEMAFNTEGVFKNLNLRKAIAFAIDRDKVTNKFIDLESAWSDAQINSSIYNSDLKNEYFYDLKMSNYYLDNEGWVVDDKDGFRKKDGQILTINLLAGKNKAQEEFSKYMSDVCKYLGIKLNLKQTYQLEDEMKNKDSYDIVLYTKKPNVSGFDRVSWFGSKNVLPNGKNYSRYRNFSFDDVLYSNLTVNLLKEQRDLSKMLVRDIPVLPLFTYTKNVAISSKLRNFKPNAEDGNTWNSLEWYAF